MAAAGAIFPDIDPTTTSGTQLATLLNDFKDAVRQGFYTDTGSRPVNLGKAGYWVDIQNDPVWNFNLYDQQGGQDITIFTTNRSTGSVSVGTLGDEVEILKASDDALAPILNLYKTRVTGTGQTQANDLLGQINFSGQSDTPVEQIICQIEAIATENVQDASHGGELRFYVTKTASAALVQAMTLKNSGLLGLGTTAPTDRLHASGNSTATNVKVETIEDSTIGPKLKLRKQRIAGSGQVVSGDVIGEVDFISTDQNGDEQTTARIQAKATETTTDSAQGTELIIYSIENGSTVLTEKFKISDGKVFINQSQYENFESTFVMQDSTAARDLLDIDGTLYNAFEITVLAYGRDNTVEKRAQKTVISGVYNDTDSNWYYGKDETVYTDTDKLLTFNFTNAQTLEIDYVNQFNPANFLDGDISLIVKRVAK